MSEYTEVEQPFLAQLATQGWEVARCSVIAILKCLCGSSMNQNPFVAHTLAFLNHKSLCGSRVNHKPAVHIPASRSARLLIVENPLKGIGYATNS